MKRLIPSVIFLLIFIPNIYALTFYVSKEGSDKNDGTAEKPFATIQKAKKAVRDTIKEGLDEDIKVVISGGTYKLQKPLTFNANDIAVKNHSIIFGAAENEKPVISGGKLISDWKKIEDNLWCAEIPAVKKGSLWFRSLYKNGKRLIRSREPDNDYYKIKSKPEDFKHIEIKENLKFQSVSGQNTELIVIVNWSINRGIIEKIKENTVVTKTKMGRYDHPWTSPQVGKHVFFEHALEFVDEPGEWYLDENSGKLYYMAEENENPNDYEFIYPILQQLLIIEGNRDHPVSDLHFKGLTFRHTDWKLPAEGYVALQDAYYGYLKEDNNNDTYCQPAAIEFKHSKNSSIELCELFGTGASGISIGAGCKNIKIEGCKIYDIGATGVHVGHRDHILQKPDEDWKDTENVPADNEILNNYIHHCGRISFGAVGIFTAFTDSTLISHNLLHDMPYTGISVGFKWNSTRTSQKNNRVEFNRLYSVMKKLADGGAIYTLGDQQGATIINNLVYDVQRWKYASPTLHPWANNAFFFDAGSKNILVKDNIAFDLCSDKVVRFNIHTSFGGSPKLSEEMQWKNNYFGVDVTEPDFPWYLAAKTGLQQKYKKILLPERKDLDKAPPSRKP